MTENGGAETRCESLKAVRSGVERGRAGFEASSMLPWLLHLLLDGSRALEVSRPPHDADESRSIDRFHPMVHETNTDRMFE